MQEEAEKISKNHFEIISKQIDQYKTLELRDYLKYPLKKLIENLLKANDTGKMDKYIYDVKF